MLLTWGPPFHFYLQRKVSFINLGLEFGKWVSALDWTHYTQVKIRLLPVNDDDWFYVKIRLILITLDSSDFLRIASQKNES